jgi:hypothetical protein
MSTKEYYLEDLLNELLADALELKKEASSEFERGKLMGYYEVILTVLNQARAFGITESLPEKVRQFDPESLLNPN